MLLLVRDQPPHLSFHGGSGIGIIPLRLPTTHRPYRRLVG
jgi:hypothetical protein